MSVKQRVVFYDVTPHDRPVIEAEVARLSGVEAVIVEDELTSDTIDKEATIISPFVSSEVTSELIKSFPKLTSIACRSTGFDNVALDAANDKKVVVSNVPSYGEHTVAEYAFGLVLTLSRKLLLAREAALRGSLDHEGLVGFDLVGKTMGVVGAGRIGRHVIQIARGFGMNVVAFDVYRDEVAAAELGFTYAKLEDVLGAADVVSLHVPYMKENHHLIGEKEFNLMKEGAILINTARGELINTECMVEALASGHLGGAGLDVLENETLLDFREELLLLQPHGSSKEALKASVEHDILMKMPNVIVTNHNAFNTTEARARIVGTTIGNIESFLAGKPANVVNPIGGK